MFSAARIVALRKSRGWSQEALAEQSGVSLRTIQRVEQGDTVPRGHTVQALATALGVALDALREPPITTTVVAPAVAPAAPGAANQAPAALPAMLFDSGSSAFALLTSADEWNELARSGAPVHTAVVNSVGRLLTAHTAPTGATLRIGPVALPLGTTTYMEGTSWNQELMMRFSGMAGMLGNASFSARTVLLDVRGGRFGLLRP
jgi:transcriptional regulator with XRE-family HTH domain